MSPTDPHLTRLDQLSTWLLLSRSASLPIEVGTDVSNSLRTVRRDERRCLSYPMTQIACVLMTAQTRRLVPELCLLELVAAVGTYLQWDVLAESNIPRFKFLGRQKDLLSLTECVKVYVGVL